MSPWVGPAQFLAAWWSQTSLDGVRETRGSGVWAGGGRCGTRHNMCNMRVHVHVHVAEQRGVVRVDRLLLLRTLGYRACPG
eukprot:397036-Prymnesium_polylepis.2